MYQHDTLLYILHHSLDHDRQRQAVFATGRIDRFKPPVGTSFSFSPPRSAYYCFSFTVDFLDDRRVEINAVFVHGEPGLPFEVMRRDHADAIRLDDALWRQVFDHVKSLQQGPVTGVEAD